MRFSQTALLAAVVATVAANPVVARTGGVQEWVNYYECCAIRDMKDHGKYCPEPKKEDKNKDVEKWWKEKEEAQKEWKKKEAAWKKDQKEKEDAWKKEQKEKEDAWKKQEEERKKKEDAWRKQEEQRKKDEKKKQEEKKQKEYDMCVSKCKAGFDGHH